MVTETVGMRGHIIESLLLSRVLDAVIELGGEFEILSLDIGRQPHDSSEARIRLSAPTQAQLDHILQRIHVHGADSLSGGEVQLQASPADGVFPDGFYVTSNQRTEVHCGGKWIQVQPVRMDCAIVVDPDGGTARTCKFAQVREGDLTVVGHRGIRVTPQDTDLTESTDSFEFMASNVSSEKSKRSAIRTIAQEMQAVKATGQQVLVVAGPAVVHTGASPHLSRLIELGYVDVLYAGNALAVHDIELALYETSLGIHLDEGRPIEHGHQHHIYTINRIRAAGGIQAAVDQGLLTSGIMHSCIRQGIDVILAGSIRDDGPLPEVITDITEAQAQMAGRLQGVGMVLMIASMLHAIAVGNLLPAVVKTVCVDINPSVVTKLMDRGSTQTIGLVTDVEPFFLELLGHLDTSGKGEKHAG
jgi:lysine-ketoglutarate reductase/saccharopine dehydrogenase-like protein (TIGR00300 family)